MEMIGIKGVLGIIASKILEIYYKPVIVISFLNKIGVGSARSIDNIDLGKIIFQAKHENIIIKRWWSFNGCRFKNR